jgi:outer membrane receptor protein involved in Fe transport
VTPQIAGGPCVAYNPFGQQNTQAATDFSFHSATRYDTIDQEILGGFLTFDSEEMFSLPGGAISFATGFEYREETSKTVTDEFTQRGFSSNAATPDSMGGFDVTEAFIEFDAPILKDLPFVHSLTIDGAYRTADYSHVDEDVTAWKVGFGYAPIEDVRIRATFGESVRAPNIEEAFSPQSPGFSNISDPCDADNIGNDPDRTANCAALGIPAGFQANDNVSIDVLSGGNPDLMPENSESTTLGVVFTPSFVENLTVTVDYFQIEITDAIASVAAQTVINNCVDGAGGLDAAFCAGVDRSPVTNDIELVRSGYINMSKLTTEGYELESRYSMGLEQFDLQGDLSFRLNLTHIADYTSFEFQNKPDEIDQDHGEIGIPEWQGQLTATYSLGDLAVTWSSRYIDDQALIDLTPEKDTPEDLEIWKLDAVFYHNLDVGYQLTDDLRISGGIRNLANELPHPITSNSIFDSVGRRAYANLTYRF